MTRRLPRRWATIHIPTIAKPITWLYPFVCACFKNKLHVSVYIQLMADHPEFGFEERSVASNVCRVQCPHASHSGTS